MWHADFLAKSETDKDAALRFYTRNACDGDPSNDMMATLLLVNDRYLTAMDYAGFMGMDPRAVCALMTMPDMNYRAPIAEGDVAMHKQRLRRLADAESVRHIDNRFNSKMGEHYDIGAIMRVRIMTPDQRLAAARPRNQRDEEDLPEPGQTEFLPATMLPQMVAGVPVTGGGT